MDKDKIVIEKSKFVEIVNQVSILDEKTDFGSGLEQVGKLNKIIETIFSAEELKKIRGWG